MQVNSTLNPAKAEHAEFDAVMKVLSETPRLAKLLGYIGEKYFLGEIDQISEYNIATEVFGRSKAVFNASEDAIVRVEATERFTVLPLPARPEQHVTGR